ncbi:protein translocase SEC61 complex subunit gamma [Candidatus Bathyarchaeota archaeon]|nr:MAG: protein translocase SEC61 complex subunit gamma [Candidatus Bathyarchaeota archaeon]
MGLRSFLNSCIRTLKLSSKPSKKELWLSLKISFLGIGVVGIIGFIVRLISSLLAVTAG